MEQVMLWVTVFGIIVIPLIGWLINTLITKKIDSLEDAQKSDRETFFKRLDAVKDDLEKNYVRKDMYEQALKFHSEQTSAEFKSILSIVNTQFSNMEDKIDDIKKLINEKFNKKGD